MKEKKEVPVWRILLSLAISIFFITRLFLEYSNLSSNTDSFHGDNPFKKAIQEITGEANEKFDKVKNNKSNEALYDKYADINVSLQEKREKDGIIKLVNDSLVNIDYYSKIKIPKNSYFQNNYSDSLKFAIKMPNNLNIFIHSFPAQGEVRDNFASLKRASDLKEFNFDYSIKDVLLFHYKLTENKIKFNGYGVVVSKEDAKLILMEFESKKLTQKELKKLLVKYIAENKIVIH
ncbi:MULTISPECIES: hypothetical protein [unclassified Arcicella]|uniref:hypothetical protein n=1 Tax=unclassified Arcicella TaxID=2644986 RepID=UPI00285B661C|nr:MULTISPECIES: hypothetical protein [unclassified Arcicella]MDR6565004.1 hypothetical protein [Arcicella sp. BE51]MDR6814817.1 hypothetical protein [Arcicella sp. BE140]MDR6826263.1 hypothetical protein [Arcicella sp. BE139]